MAHRTSFLIFVGACLALAACNSGPSSSASSKSRQDQAATLERKADHIEGLLARRSLAANMLDALTSALPDRAWLTDVAYDAGKVQVKGKAPSNNLVADYLSRLEGRQALTSVVLHSSAMKIVRGREQQEFAFEAVAHKVVSTSASSGLPLAARLEELERSLPTRQNNAEMLRDLQRLALDAGLQMTKFAPSAEIPGEFTSEWPVAIEVQGDRSELAVYLRGLAELPRLWVVDRFSFKPVSGDDPRSQIHASITARTYFAP
jgi:hypothetical protein